MIDKIVNEAISWERTPYHHMARIKGVGVDCGQILIEVYSAVGLVPNFETGYYPMDWALHREEERYLGFVEQYAHPVKEFQKGDIALYRFGRCISHAGIIISDDGMMIHAQADVGVIRAHYLEGALQKRFIGFYRVNGVSDV